MDRGSFLRDLVSMAPAEQPQLRVALVGASKLPLSDMWNLFHVRTRWSGERGNFRSMITTPTVFILGAGMSAHYGLPLGDELCNRITGYIGSLGTAEKLMVTGRPMSRRDMGSFREALHEYPGHSIDAFLEDRPEFQELGRVLIAKVLVPLEQHKALFPDDKRVVHPYRYIFNQMAGGDLAEFMGNRVTFVTFNYDRSLEHYFTIALQRRHGKTAEEAGAIVRGMHICHVHGSFGPLPAFGGDLGYGASFASDDHLCATASGLRLIGDQFGEDDMHRRIVRRLHEARHVFVLGFGFHPRNMARLNFSKVVGGYVSCTTYGMRERDRQRVKSMLPASQFRHRIHEPTVDCLGLLTEEFHADA